MSPRTPLASAPFSAGLPVLKAQRLIDLIALRLAPAVVAGLIGWSHMGSLGDGVIVLASVLAASTLVERSTLPLHLIAAARVLLAAAGPVFGAGVAWAVCAAAGNAEPLGWAVPVVLGAWLLLALGAWVKVRAGERMDARVAVLGSPAFTQALMQELSANDIGGYSVVGWIGPETPLADPQVRRLAPLTRLRETVLRHGIDLLVVAPPDSPGAPSEPELYELVADECLDLQVRALGANQLYEELLGHVPLGTVDAAWFRYIMHPRFDATPAPGRRLFDLLAGGLLAIAAAPIVAVAAVAVKLTDSGPAFYWQRRLGERGRPFEMVKLRSMRVDAEAEHGAQWARSDDDRITPVGRILRRTHVDELPQLWNVFRGDMTLVGPRPERPEIAADLERRFHHYSRRGLVKPGVTGWAQIRCGYAGSEEGTAWKLCHDLFYVKHRSFLADVLILLQTAFEATRDAHRVLRAPQPRFILGEEHEQRLALGEEHGS